MGACSSRGVEKTDLIERNRVDANEFGIVFLASLDDRLEKLLSTAAIKLVHARFIRQTTLVQIKRRQDLEKLEAENGAIFLTPTEAIAALRANARSICALTYGWTSPDHPDMSGAYLAALRHFLCSDLAVHIQAVFWE